MIGHNLFRSLCVLGETYSHLRAAERGRSPSAIKKSWSTEMLKLVNVECSVIGQPIPSAPALYVGNHISYLDIVLLMGTVTDLSFVAKKELSTWPLFGTAARKAGTVFVDRSNLGSRMRAKSAVLAALETEKRRIAIFPAGTTTLDEEKPWKLGAFRLAQESGAPLQPFRISYYPLRTAAFIDKDVFPLHLLGACGPEKIYATLEFADPIFVSDPVAECAKWQAWTQNREARIPAPDNQRFA